MEHQGGQPVPLTKIVELFLLPTEKAEGPVGKIAGDG